MKSDDWITPSDITKPLGKFDLDPCVSLNQPWFHAMVNYTKKDNGLNSQWFGRVWLNPPYSQIKTWLDKLCRHDDGIALVHSRVTAPWFFDYVFDKASSLLFLRSRISFYRDGGFISKSSNPEGSILVSYGEKNDDYLENYPLKGKFIKLNQNGRNLFQGSVKDEKYELNTWL